MSVNINNFKNVLKKATLNYSLDTVQINLAEDKITSKMMTNASDAVVMLNLKNNVIDDIKKNDDIQLNFIEPNNTLIPYINLLENDDRADIEFHKEKITIKSDTGSFKADIFFCDPSIVSVFNRPDNKNRLYISTFDIDDNFHEKYEMIKKIGVRFGKIYFTVKNNMLKIETTDKTILYSNALIFDLYKLEHNDFTFCFDYKNFTNIMSSIGSAYHDFKIAIIQAPGDNNNAGMLIFENKDSSEKYFIVSRLDI